MRAYQSSTSTLKQLLAHPSLQRDHIDATMESMSDALADHAEIEQAISLGNEQAQRAAGVEDVDEAELDDELAELVRVETEAKELQRTEERRKAEAAEERGRAVFSSSPSSSRPAVARKASASPTKGSASRPVSPVAALRMARSGMEQSPSRSRIGVEGDEDLTAAQREAQREETIEREERQVRMREERKRVEAE